jgi:glycosyltransferase involved in cell wall biosynthesis
VIFFGLFTPLQGTPVLGQALRMLTGSTNVHVLMVGHGQDYACTRALAAGASFVQWRDWVPIDELAELTATYDVCLGIFGDSPKAMRVVPNKIYQGAAAGCAIITSDTEPQRRTLGNAAHFVRPGDATALAGALRTLAGDRAQLRTLQAAARDVADTTFRPEIVVKPFRECLIAMTAAGRHHTMSDR